MYSFRTGRGGGFWPFSGRELRSEVDISESDKSRNHILALQRRSIKRVLGECEIQPLLFFDKEKCDV
jgi:hypothetical protein